MGPLSPNQLSRLFLPIVALSLLGCAAAGTPAESPQISDVRRTPEIEARPESALTKDEAAPPAPLLTARVDAGSLGPRLQLGENGKLVVWVTTEGPYAGYHSVFLSNAGERTAPTRLMVAEATLRQLELGTMSDGTVVVSTVRRRGDEDVLEVLYLGAEGELRNARQRVADVPGGVLWSQVTSGVDGGLIFWAQGTGDLAAIYVAPLRKEGPGHPSRVVGGVSAWQVIEADSAVTLATVEGTSGAAVVVRQLGAIGQVLGAPLQLAKGVDGALDLDMAASKSQITVAWSAREKYQSRLYGATLDRSGNVLHAARPLTVPRGNQALVRVIGSLTSDVQYFIWDEPEQGEGSGRALFVGKRTIQDDALVAVASLQVDGTDALLPSFAGAPGGLALLTETADLGRMGIIWGEKVASTPLSVPGENQLTMSWDLSCSKNGCFALLADDGYPTNIYVAELQGKPLDSSALHMTPESELPRVVSREPFAEVPELSALGGLRSATGSGDLLSMVSYFDPMQPSIASDAVAPDGRRDPVRALLKNISVGATVAHGQLETSTEVISYRARSLGGVALVRGENEHSLLAWAALDNQTPQLFATILDAQGRKIRQKMLTREKGEVSDISAVRVGDAYEIAWVDGRGPTSQVFTMRVDEQLRIRRGAGALTSLAVAPTGLDMTVIDEQVFLTWADSQRDGDQSDIYFASVDAKTGQPLRGPVRLMETHGHSHSPEFGVTKDNAGVRTVVCAWVDELGGEEEGGASRLSFVRLSSDGVANEEPTDVPVLGSVADFSLSCDDSACRALLAVEIPKPDGRQAGSLWGATYRPGFPPVAKQLLGLRAGLTTGVTPVLVGGDAYFADLDSGAARWLLHRARIEWFTEGVEAP
jgi:hypothetical protein